MDLVSKDGKVLTIKVYYSPNMDDTIISPQSIATQHSQNIQGWYQSANIDDDSGTVGFLMYQGPNLEFNLKSINNLWFHSNTTKEQQLEGSVVNSLSDAQAYNLWHARMGHPGVTAMNTLHHHVRGIKALRGNTFYRCPSCMPMKLTIKKPLNVKQQRQTTPATAIETNQSTTDETKDDIILKNINPGQHLHMDFGFVRGKEYSHQDKQGKIMTSIDGYKSYLLIIDRATRYAWIFLTSSKNPPVKEAEAVLQKFGSKDKHKIVCTDQGKELGLSVEFKKMLAKNDYVLKITGSDNSRENGRAK